MNKTQRLQRWYDENGTADSLLFGEFMHLGANQTILKVGLFDIEPDENSVILDMACAVGGNARWLASLYNCTVYGNDIDEVARVLKPGGRFLLSALFRLDAPNPEEIANQHGLEVELRRDVTELAQTFLHSKEEEARLLQKSKIISDRQLITVINNALRRRGGHHLLVRWRKADA